MARRLVLFSFCSVLIFWFTDALTSNPRFFPPFSPPFERHHLLHIYNKRWIKYVWWEEIRLLVVFLSPPSLRFMFEHSSLIIDPSFFSLVDAFDWRRRINEKRKFPNNADDESNRVTTSLTFPLCSFNSEDESVDRWRTAMFVTS